MTYFNCFILALFAALMFFNIDVDLAARCLQQLSPLLKIGLSPLPQPTIPTVLKSGSLPRLPSIPNLSSAPKSYHAKLPFDPYDFNHHSLYSFPLSTTINYQFLRQYGC
ncbi:hypothetical protein V6N11_015035 [Hibiscus sabdariffa]|uniref:Uncharacterized protein n=1 Tax=Hibiscus sabdariffa TaxID=183260 RepID=A0ABR2TRF1_9ROSI